MILFMTLFNLRKSKYILHVWTWIFTFGVHEPFLVGSKFMDQVVGGSHIGLECHDGDMFGLGCCPRD